MDIKFNEMEIIKILEAIRSELIFSKRYYKENESEEDRIGVTSPEEWAEIYNNILKQSQEKGILTMLDLVQ
ncbi:hypothetical protein [Inconstantimicrobium mannanitabidum]|uniref:hypothetical protein n=1 Tax=Inconstantimicrobium mannanitabidum TaxID=1604901 RepID=UPI0021C45ADB|nr:hypothetical protein [Clostridium sp. TW13]